MLVAAALCPCPPLLVPEVAAGAAPELDAARTACSDAVAVLAAARPDRLVVIGPAEEAGRGTHPEGTPGSFRGFGVDLAVRLGRTGKDTVSERQLPPSLAVGAWLLERADWSSAPVEGLGVGDPLAPERCAEVGREIGAQPGRVALLVMGDASACRTLKAPGYLDERAVPFDREAARALGAADIAALKALDAGLARELKAVSRAPGRSSRARPRPCGLSGTLLYEDAPYGVGYVVAAWS